MAKTANKPKAAKPLPDVADLTKAQAKVEHKRLALEIETNDRLYHQEDAPKISDARTILRNCAASTVSSRFIARS